MKGSDAGMVPVEELVADPEKGAEVHVAARERGEQRTMLLTAEYETTHGTVREALVVRNGEVVARTQEVETTARTMRRTERHG